MPVGCLCRARQPLKRPVIAHSAIDMAPSAFDPKREAPLGWRGVAKDVSPGFAAYGT